MLRFHKYTGTLLIKPSAMRALSGEATRSQDDRSMCLTVLQQTIKGLPRKTRDEAEAYPRRDPVVRDLERL